MAFENNLYASTGKPLISITIKVCICFKILLQIFKSMHLKFADYLFSYFHSWIHKSIYVLRSDSAIAFEVPRSKKQGGDRAFFIARLRLWNKLLTNIRLLDSVSVFKSSSQVIHFSCLLLKFCLFLYLLFVSAFCTLRKALF